jgi:hypothetical protein
MCITFTYSRNFLNNIKIGANLIFIYVHKKIQSKSNIYTYFFPFFITFPDIFVHVIINQLNFNCNTTQKPKYILMSFKLT